MFTFEPNPHKKFIPMYRNKGLIICIGGRGGMKSYETSKWGALRLVSNFGTRGVLIREEAVTIQNSILNEVKSRFEEINAKTDDYYTQVYDIQDNKIKNKLQDRDAIFTLGIRDSANYKQARLKSLSELDFSITEEAEDIRDENKYFKLIDSIRHPDAVNIINLNVPDKNHWIVKRFFNTVASDYEGWYNLEPRNIDGVTIIQTSFEDNQHLPQNIIDRYRAYGDPNSPFYNPEYYYNQILGLCSEGKKGRVYTHVRPCTLDEYNSLTEYETVYGLDFGYSNDPTSLVEVKMHNNKVYFRTLIYSTGMTNDDISKEMEMLGVKKDAYIYPDSAEPKSAEDLRRKGWNIRETVKGTGSVNAGIDLLKQKKLFCVENDTHGWYELQNYTWKLDRDKNPTNEAVDVYNHALDALRYAVFSHKPRAKAYGIVIPIPDSQDDEITYRVRRQL